MTRLKLNKNHLLILDFLRENARISFADISRSTGIPTSTVFDYYQYMQIKEIILKPVSLIDFNKLGCSVHILIFLKVKKKLELTAFLKKNKNINNLVRLDKFDFCLEAFFKNLDDYELFFSQISEFGIVNILKFDVLDEIKTQGAVC